MGTWQSNERNGNSSLGSSSANTDYLTASVSINRQLSSFASGYLQYFHMQSNSGNLNNVSNTLSGIGSYDSNRVTAGVSVNF